MIKTVLFDFDGVILDSYSELYRWFSEITPHLGKQFPYATIDQFRNNFREPVYPNMYNQLGLEWEKNKEKIWKKYHEFQAQNGSRPFPQIKEVLEELSQKYQLGIASSNMRETIDRHLCSNQLNHFFKFIISKEDVSINELNELNVKPHPECLILALKKAGCLPSEAIYIGDQPTDIIAAQRVAGVAEYLNQSMPVIAVAYGFATKEKLTQHYPNYLAENPLEIIEAVKFLDFERYSSAK